jgi:predicted nucleotidyltransferase
VTPNDLADVHRVLAKLPRLRELLDDLLEQLRGPDTIIAVGGSVERGRVDRWSDLDLLVIATSPDELAARRRAVNMRLRRRYEVVASFDAAHLGLDCLDSVFLVVTGAVVKADIAYWATGWGPTPVGGVIVHDGPGSGYQRGVPIDEVLRAPIDLPGWTCHVRKIVRRGELFESAHCLNEMRRRFLVPLLLELHGAPQVNYRRIESRLPGNDLDVLRATLPRELSRAAVDAALSALLDGFVAAYRRLPADRRAVLPDDLEHRIRLARTLPVG